MEETTSSLAAPNLVLFSSTFCPGVFAIFAKQPPIREIVLITTASKCARPNPTLLAHIAKSARATDVKWRHVQDTAKKKKPRNLKMLSVKCICLSRIVVSICALKGCNFLPGCRSISYAFPESFTDSLRPHMRPRSLSQ